MKNIAIIGAGIAGLSAAEHLSGKGHNVHVYEIKPSPGGRIYSLKDKTTGDMVDNGQHILVGAYRRTLQLMELSGTTEKLKTYNGLDIQFRANDVFHRIKYCSLPGKLSALGGLLGFTALNLKEKMKLISFASKVNNENYSALKDDCYSYLLKNGQSMKVIKFFWEPLILATINNKPKDAPAKLLVKILQDAFFKGNKESALILPKVDLSKLIVPLTETLADRGVKFHFGTNIRSVNLDESTCKGLITSKNEFDADAVISTVQPNILARLLPEKVNISGTLKSFSFSPIISTYLWYDRQFLAEDIYALIDTNIQWVFNKRNFSENDPVIKEKYPAFLSLTTSAAGDMIKMRSEDIIKTADKEIKHVFPEADRAELLHGKVIKEKQATFKADIFTENIRPDSKTGIQNFYLAGDWTNTSYPATIEGAALSGLNAAFEIQKEG